MNKTRKSKFVNQLRNIIGQSDSFVVFWLSFLGFLAFGLLIPTLGFYWDDLPILFAFDSFGPGYFPQFLASDRPFSAWVFILTTSLFKFNPIPYHILLLILRIFSAVLFYGIIKEFVPNQKDVQLIAASLFLLYPGFLQGPIALIYNHHFFILNFFLFSIWLMVRNEKRKIWNPIWGILSLATTFHMFSIENFSILEIIRPVLLWISIPKTLGQRTRTNRFIKHYLPYFAIFILFLYWRVFILSFPTYKPGFLSSMATDPLQAINTLLARIPEDLVTSIVNAWIDTFVIPKMSDFGTLATYLFYALTIATIILTFLCIYLRKIYSPIENSRKLSNMFFISLLLLLLGGGIVWVLDLPFQIEFAWDRMALAFIPGVSLFFTSMYLLIRKVKVLPVLFISVLIGTAVGAHFQNGMSFKRDWENFQDFFWQLSWRIPSMKMGSALIGSETGLEYYSDNSLTAPINLTYSEEISSEELDYVFLYTNVRLNSGLPSLKKNVPINQHYRTFKFIGNTSQVLSVVYKPPACLKITDRIYSNSITNPNLSFTQVDELKLSNLDLISQSPQVVPFQKIFPNNNQRNWCYYFERADLARQFHDFSEVANLGKKAIAEGIFPRDAAEWLPFLEGFLFVEDWETAQLIAEKVAAAEGNYLNGLCYTMRRIHQSEVVMSKNQLQEMIEEFNCE